MKKTIYEGKNYEEALNNALDSEKVSEDNLIINILEEKNTLLKKLVKIEVINYNDIVDFAKEKINEILKLMNLECNLEVRRREQSITIKIFSDHNAVLIGRKGSTIAALQTIIRQILYKETNQNIPLILDVENYKEKRVKNIEWLAKKTAREVAKTGIEVKMDSMNSYERRIIHSILSEDKYVYTESTGEEPNRCVVIKPKEDK